MGIKKIITACSDCFAVLSREYSLKEEGIEVEHFVQTVASLLEQSKVKMKNWPGVITYHDPCQLARKAKITDAPRQSSAIFRALILSR